MRRIALILILIALTVPAVAQKESSVLKKADKMIAERQYESAYKMLDEFDPTNDRPAVVLKKESLVLNYFTQSIMHRMFSLQDLAEGESLDSIRANYTSGNVIVFEADSLLLRLLAKNPGNKELLAGHTSYHDAVLNDYNSDIWSMYIDSVCLELLTADKENPTACYQVGLFYNMEGEDFEKAEHFYRQTVTLCDTHYHAHYNLGIMEYYLEKFPAAATHVRRAYFGYQQPTEKADAARVLGILYDNELDNADSALHYFQQATAIDSSYLNNAFLLGYYLKHNDPRAESLARHCWALAVGGDSPFEDANDLLARFLNQEMTDAAVQFLTQRNNEASNDFDRGLSSLYLGQLLADKPSQAIPWIEAAIQSFEKESAPEEFISSLRQMIEDLQQK